MPDTFFDRHQDNVLDVGTILAGKKVFGLPLVLDPDAPFIMKALAVRCDWELEIGQSNLQYLYFKLKRANGSFLSQDWIPLLYAIRAFGQGGNPGPIWPHENYPANSALEIDLWNNNSTDVDIDGLEIVFRGCRRYAPRDNLYPKQIREIRNYTRSLKVTVGITPVAGGDVRNVQIFPSMTNNTFIGSDFVLRKITGGALYNPNSPAAYFQPRNVWLTLKDGVGKPYSNAPVDINILAQQPMATASIPNANQFGPWHPGLVYPEIYVPEGEALTVDILRDDTAFIGQAGLAADRIDLAFGGVKVYRA